MISKINGYDLYLGVAIILNGDRSTTSSFEAPNDVNPVFSHTWEDGVTEYDLNAIPTLVARVFQMSGWMVVDNLDDYLASKTALQGIIYQNYVTFEDPEQGIQVNARLKPGSIKWNRLTPLDAPRIVTEVSMQFDEVLQDAPFKNDGNGGGLTYYIGDNGKYFLTEDNENYIK
ncbi:hypothetical protein SAMN05421821_105126 [Mucilaginibacter lappiensis]|uniref:Uncharacterized protein n=1 Tax=Mucilaginibacter lappiensis TaxID=354630 RepID=A0ABR6PIX1_9SPHI|nr:hypothetical protein [Mucilaginibacter lappiensis]MBB6109707.1 hypothetical protein [Mucilaginibacter lappiensis]SIR12608.1 hypothetical protein SAMN05421821_105126 [Mucilaginibacter lappiensis]